MMDPHSDLLMLHSHLAICRWMSSKRVLFRAVNAALVSSALLWIVFLFVMHTSFVPAPRSCLPSSFVRGVLDARRRNQSFVVTVTMDGTFNAFEPIMQLLPDDLVQLVEPEKWRFSHEKGLLMLKQRSLNRLKDVAQFDLKLDVRNSSCYGSALWKKYFSVVGGHVPIANNLVAAFGSGFCTCEIGICALVRPTGWRNVDPFLRTENYDVFLDYLLGKALLLLLCITVQRVVNSVVFATFAQSHLPIAHLVGISREALRHGQFRLWRNQNFLRCCMPLVTHLAALFGLVFGLSEILEDSVLGMVYLFLNWFVAFCQLTFLRTVVASAFYRDFSRCVLLIVLIYNCSFYSLGFQFEVAGVAGVVLATTWMLLMSWLEVPAVENNIVSEQSVREGVLIRRINVELQQPAQRPQ